ncbi:MAG: ABC transporter substrate-binding protein [Acidimicrobiales bacterium]|jgi:uncharacterized small protein (DUF1192 family)
MPSTPDDLSRLLAPTYLDNVDGLTVDEVRRMRAECQEAEASLSYLRRLIQGRLDIVHAYLDRPAGSEAPDLSSVVDNLAGILAGPGRPSGPGHNPVLHTPDTEEMAELTTELDGVLGVDEIGRLGDLDSEALRTLADRLTELEGRVSAERHGLHQRIDTLQAELVERHKSGRASVDGLLS